MLLDRGLISASQVVDSDLTVLDCSRRNRNFKILSERGPCYMFKQGTTAEKKRTVRHEAIIYALVDTCTEETELRGLLPRLCLSACVDGLLVLELARRSKNLREYHESARRISHSLAETLGRAVAAIHGSHLATRSPDVLERDPPHGLSLHRPDLAIFRHASQGCLDVLAILHQSPSVIRALDELKESWSADAFIHSDLRWDNCIVHPPQARGGRARVQIVDWELARVGDPAWDIGTIFAEHLSAWIQSAPLSEKTPPESFLKFAQHPLERMQPAICGFWNAYSLQRPEANTETRHAFFLRAVRFAGARLVQTAFEAVQSASTATPSAVLLLQLCENILSRPSEAGSQLLGIPMRQRRCA